jgi:HSP20 family protein
MPKNVGPFLEVARIQSEINRLFENLLDLNNPGGGTGWNPNVDILETDERLVVKIELPGVELNDLELSVNSGNLLIAGERREPEIRQGARMIQVEQAFGQFRRSINLGVPVNTRRAEAEMSDGLLTVRFPKVPNRRGEDVQIEVKGS